ncbi:hypothetical protein AAFO92_05105 [Roseovarius sp. CAU 1744]|uniref:hypothetical protein n=1 Tax=Roseovarius sp. CAU 1744 TaxID=3140368 RepID=UPI00325B795F
MTQSSFTERLKRIEAAENRPVTERILVGVAEEAIPKADEKKKRKSGRRGGAAALPLRFVMGFALMFLTFQLMGEMKGINNWLNGVEPLVPYTNMAMAAIAISIAAVMLFFAFKLQRAAFRLMTEPGRLPFAIGMVAGIALGLGPTEFADGMMAQLHLDQP